MASKKITAFLVNKKKTIYDEKAIISLVSEFTLDISFSAFNVT